MPKVFVSEDGALENAFLTSENKTVSLYIATQIRVIYQLVIYKINFPSYLLPQL